jgi:hypothetical protein
MPLSRRRRFPNGRPQRRPQRRTRLTHRHAALIVRDWHHQVTQLREQLDQLEEQNARLAAALVEAARVCDEAVPRTGEHLAIASHVRRVGRSVLSQGLRSLRPWVAFVLRLSGITFRYRHHTHHNIGWPFEPALFVETRVGSPQLPASKEHKRLPLDLVCPSTQDTGATGTVIYLVSLLAMIMFILSLLGLP